MIVPSLGDLPVFPCRANKKPLIAKGFHAAKRIEPEPWWPLVGVPTGVATGFDVLDVDPQGLDWLADHLLPATRMHRTRRGWHFLFRAAEGLHGSADDRIADGVDVRASGNYVIWWPSTGLEVVSRPLAEWPPELLDLAKSKAKLQGVVGGPIMDPRVSIKGMGRITLVHRTTREWRYGRAALRNAFEKMSECRAGRRNDLLNKLAFKMGGLVANGWIEGDTVVKVLMNGAKACRLAHDDGAQECLSTIHRGLSAGIRVPYPALAPLPILPSSTGGPNKSANQQPKGTSNAR